jgi:hypothetical protein
MEIRNPKRVWKKPELKDLGRIETVTQVQDKNWGPNDGFTLMGIPIHNAS